MSMGFSSVIRSLFLSFPLLSARTLCPSKPSGATHSSCLKVDQPSTLWPSLAVRVLQIPGLNYATTFLTDQKASNGPSSTVRKMTKSVSRMSRTASIFIAMKREATAKFTSPPRSSGGHWRKEERQTLSCESHEVRSVLVKADQMTQREVKCIYKCILDKRPWLLHYQQRCLDVAQRGRYYGCTLRS